MYYLFHKTIGILLLLLSMWLAYVNYNNLMSYAILVYAALWVVTSFAISHQTKKYFAAAIIVYTPLLLVISMQFLKRVIFVSENNGLEGVNGEGSPLAFLFGFGIELLLFLFLVILFLLNRLSLRKLFYR